MAYPGGESGRRRAAAKMWMWVCVGVPVESVGVWGCAGGEEG